MGLSVLPRRRQLPAAAGNNHGEKEVVGQNTKTMKMRLKSLKSSIKLKGTAAMNENSLWIHYCKLPLFYQTKSFDLCLCKKNKKNKKIIGAALILI